MVTHFAERSVLFLLASGRTGPGLVLLDPLMPGLTFIIPAAQGYAVHEVGLPRSGTGTGIRQPAVQLLAQPLTSWVALRKRICFLSFSSKTHLLHPKNGHKSGMVAPS